MKKHNAEQELERKMRSETSDKLRLHGYQEWEIRKGFYEPKKEN